MSELFHITLEGNNLDEFDSTVTDGGDLSAEAAAALVGSYGLSCLLDDTNAIYGDKNFTFSTDDLRFRIYIDPNELTMASGNRFDVVRVVHSASPWYECSVILSYDGSNYEIRALFYNDAGGFHGTGYYDISDAVHYIEIWIERASSDVASDGQGHLYIDGSLQETESGIDNYDNFALSEVFRTGANGVDSGTSGTFYLDDLILRDDSTEIGPAVAGAIMNQLQGPNLGADLYNGGIL